MAWWSETGHRVLYMDCALWHSPATFLAKPDSWSWPSTTRIARDQIELSNPNTRCHLRYCVLGLLGEMWIRALELWRGRPARHARMCRESEPFVTLLSGIEMQPPVSRLRLSLAPRAAPARARRAPAGGRGRRGAAPADSRVDNTILMPSTLVASTHRPVQHTSGPEL